MSLEEALVDAYCPCHGEPWYVQPGGKQAGRRKCIVKRRISVQQAQARYAKTEKGRASLARWWASPQGMAYEARRNSCRVRMGRIYLGMAPTAEHAAALNQMGRDFAAQQKGAA